MEEENAKEPDSNTEESVKKVPGSQNILEGNEENFMTSSPKEKKEWIKMMKSRQSTLIKKEQEHKKWQDSLLQRRVQIYNRSRKLLNAQRDRFRFLFKMSEVVKHISDQNNTQSQNGNGDNKERQRTNKCNVDVIPEEDPIHGNGIDGSTNGSGERPTATNQEDNHLVPTITVENATPR